jgi:negative regulator of sigma E activity
MSQFGMQMPSSRGKKGSGLSIYTAMAAVACVCLAVACAVLFVYGSRIGTDGQPFGIQEKGKIRLPAQK